MWWWWRRTGKTMKMWLWRLWWWFSCWKENQNQKRKVTRKNWIVEKKKRDSGKLKSRFFIRESLLSSNSSICTICSLRIREPILEKIVGQWKQQNWILTQRFHVKGELKLITLTAWINKWILYLFLVNQSKSNAFVSLRSSRKLQCKTG